MKYIAAHSDGSGPPPTDVTRGKRFARRQQFQPGNGKSGSVPWRRAAYHQSPKFKGRHPGLHEQQRLSTIPAGPFSNACHVAIVEVDIEPARHVERFLVVEDPAPVNPMIVDGPYPVLCSFKVWLYWVYSLVSFFLFCVFFCVVCFFFCFLVFLFFLFFFSFCISFFFLFLSVFYFVFLFVFCLSSVFFFFFVFFCFFFVFLFCC